MVARYTCTCCCVVCSSVVPCQVFEGSVADRFVRSFLAWFNINRAGGARLVVQKGVECDACHSILAVQNHYNIMELQLHGAEST